MKILSIIFSLVFFASACTNTEEVAEKVKALIEKDKTSIETQFLGGGITVSYDKKGGFKSITSTSTSKVTSTLPSAVEEAYKIATLKARRQIAEFMDTEIQSERFTSSVSDSLQDSENTNENVESKNWNTIALKVKENITQKSSQLLKGTFVQSEKHDLEKKLVIVIVATGIDSVGTSKRLKKLMSQ